MAWDRLGFAGAEMRTAKELPVFYTGFGSGDYVISSIAKTAGYSFAATTTTRSRGWTFSSKTSLRAGMFFYHTGVTSGRIGTIFRITSTIGQITVDFNGTTQTIDLVVNGTIQQTVSLATSGLSTTTTWFQVGIVCYAHASTGFVSFYVEGTQKLTYTGNTGTGLTEFYSIGNGAATGFTASAAFDDLYVDSSSTIETDASPPARYFDFGVASTAGTYAQWTPLSGSNVSNVDDTTPDDDTTYVSAIVADKLDSYNTTNPTYAGGLPILSNIVIAYARKTDGAFASTLALGWRESATDEVGSDNALTTTYEVYSRRTTTKPSGGAWDSSSVNAAEVLIKSTGAY